MTHVDVTCKVLGQIIQPIFHIIFLITLLVGLVGGFGLSLRKFFF